MTHIEKMKQGLEVLEEAVHYTSAPVWSPSMTKECNEAIASLRQAIAEAEKQEPVAFAAHGVVNWIADKQFMHEAELYTHPPQRTELIQNLQCFHCQETIEILNDKVMRLLAQRTWVGLDHHDKKKFSSWLDHKSDDEVFTAIEALLKEMNT